MPPQSTALLTQTGFGYAPIAAGLDHRRRLPTDGLPFTSGGFGQVAGMALTGQMYNAFGQVGMTPMGLGHDQNVFDRLMAERFTRMQMQAMQAASQADAANYTRTFRGMAALTGTPFGAEQRRASMSAANALASASPLFAEMAPDLLDQMGGSRGSAVVMARRMIDAGRYRLDPVTGRMGMSADTVGAMSNQLYGDMFSNANLPRMRGISAGQVGSMVGELQSRGLLATAASESRYAGVRSDDPRAGTLRALTAMSPSQLQDAARTTGVDMSRPGGLRAEDIDKLNMDPTVAAKLRSFDTQRIKRSVEGYAKVVSAMKEIFGDAGRPNAPMAELMAGIEALTMGGMGRMDPARMAATVRQTYNLAKQTGVSVDAAMMMQNHAASRAQALGVENVFAIQATQGSLAFGGAYRAQGQGAFGAWGAMDANQIQQLDANLRVQAAGSNMANRMAVATRLAEQVGGFDRNSAAGRYVAAVRNGMDRFVGEDGQARSVMMGDREFSQMFTAARTAGGQGAGISEGDIQTMLGQRDTNREYVERLGMTNVVRRAQGRDELHPFVGNVMTTTVANRIRDRLVASGMSPAAASERARSLANSVGQNVTRRMFDMGTEDFSNTASRNAGIAEALEDELNAAGGKDVFADMSADQRKQFLTQTADQFYGQSNRAIRGSMYRAFGNLQNVFRLTNQSTLDEADRQQMQAKFSGDMQDALSPLGKGSLLSRVVDSIQSSRPDDPGGLTRVVAQALGGVQTSDINRAMLPEFRKLQDKRKAIEDLQQRAMRETDPAVRASIMDQLEVRRRELTSQAGVLAKAGEQFGLFSADTLTSGDIGKAINSTRGLAIAQGDTVGLRGGFGNDVSQAEINAVREDGLHTTLDQAAMLNARQEMGTDVSKMSAAERAKMLNDGEARAVIRARRRAVPLDASDEDVSAIVRQYPGVSREDAEDLARAQLRARKLGVGEQEVKARIAADPKKYAGLQGQMAAISDTFSDRAGARMFDVSDVDVEEFRKSEGYLKPSAAQMKRFRDKNGFEGDEAATQAEMDKRMIRRNRQQQDDARLGEFWRSAEGGAFRDATEGAADDVDNVASKLVSSPQMVQRLGTRAIQMSDELRGGQQRLRELALYHTGGDLSKLMMRQFSVDRSDGKAEGTIARVNEEVSKIQAQQRAILNELQGQDGARGRRFQLGDEDKALGGTLDAEVAAGRMSADEAAKIKAAQPSAATLQSIRAKQRELGSEERARGILGVSNDKVLSEFETAAIAGIRFGAGNDQEVIGMYGRDRWEQLDEAKQREVMAVMRRGTGSDAEAMKLLGITDDMLRNDTSGEMKRKIEATRTGFASEAHARQLAGIAPGKELTDEDRQKVEAMLSGTHSESLARKRLGLADSNVPLRLRSEVERRRVEEGNEAEARRLLGLKPGEALDSQKAAKLMQMTYDVGIARNLSQDQEATLTGYEGRASQMKKMASLAGVREEDIQTKGDALVLSGEEKERLDRASRQWRSANQATTSRQARAASLRSQIDRLNAAEPTAANTDALARKKAELEAVEGDITKFSAERGAASAIVAEDAKKRGVSSEQYLKGQGYLTGGSLARYREMQKAQDADKKKIDEIANALGVKPEDLAGATGVTRRLLDAQAAAARKDSGDPTDLARSILKEYGFTIGDSATDQQKDLGRLMEGPGGRAMGARIRDSAQELKAVAGRSMAGGIPKGGEGAAVDAMATEYFKAMKAGGTALEGFQRKYGFQFDQYGKMTGAQQEEWSKFEKAMQFQQQTGFLTFGRKGGAGEAELGRLYSAAMRGGAQAGGGDGGDGRGSGRMELSGSVRIEGDMMDFAGAWGGGRGMTPPGGS